MESIQQKEIKRQIDNFCTEDQNKLKEKENYILFTFDHFLCSSEEKSFMIKKKNSENELIKEIGETILNLEIKQVDNLSFSNCLIWQKNSNHSIIIPNEWIPTWTRDISIKDENFNFPFPTYSQINEIEESFQVDLIFISPKVDEQFFQKIRSRIFVFQTIPENYTMDEIVQIISKNSSKSPKRQSVYLVPLFDADSMEKYSKEWNCFCKKQEPAYFIQVILSRELSDLIIRYPLHKMESKLPPISFIDSKNGKILTAFGIQIPLQYFDWDQKINQQTCNQISEWKPTFWGRKINKGKWIISVYLKESFFNEFVPDSFKKNPHFIFQTHSDDSKIVLE